MKAPKIFGVTMVCVCDSLDSFELQWGPLHVGVEKGIGIPGWVWHVTTSHCSDFDTQRVATVEEAVRAAENYLRSIHEMLSLVCHPEGC